MTLLIHYHDLPHGPPGKAARAEPRRISTTASREAAAGVVPGRRHHRAGGRSPSCIVALKTAI